jgi:hypothetical protein
VAERRWKVLLRGRHDQESDAPEPRIGDAIILARPKEAPPIIAKVAEVLPPEDPGYAGTLIVELYESVSKH